MLRVVPAVHRPTRQIDDHVCAVELSGPISNLLDIPASDTPRRARCGSPKDDDFVAIVVEDASQESPNLARAAGNNHPHAITEVGLTLALTCRGRDAHWGTCRQWLCGRGQVKRLS